MSEENISVLSSDSSTTLQVDNAALIEELENNDGDTVYPVTIDKAIYCSDGTRFDNKLQKYVHWSDDTSAEAPDVRIADNLGGQYTATDITNMSNSINTISNNLVQVKEDISNFGKCTLLASISNNQEYSDFTVQNLNNFKEIMIVQETNNNITTGVTTIPLAYFKANTAGIQVRTTLSNCVAKYVNDTTVSLLANANVFVKLYGI